MLAVSPAEKVTKVRYLSVMWLRFVKGLLLLLISEHWFEKKSLSILVLCLKSEVITVE